MVSLVRGLLFAFPGVRFDVGGLSGRSKSVDGSHIEIVDILDTGWGLGDFGCGRSFVSAVRI